MAPENQSNGEMLAAMLISRERYGRISPMLWFSGVMVSARGRHYLAARRDLHQDQADHLLQTSSPRCCLFGLLTRPQPAEERARHRLSGPLGARLVPADPQLDDLSSPAWR